MDRFKEPWQLTTKAIDKYDVYGFIIFIIVFIGIVPYTLYTVAPAYLMYYMANVDMLANILTVIEKPHIFSNLYTPEPNSFIAYLSVITINYIALLSIFYVVINFARKTSTFKGIILAGIMVMITFLIPTYVIPNVIDQVEKHITSRFKSERTKLFITYGFALLTALSFIVVEKEVVEFLLERHYDQIFGMFI